MQSDRLPELFGAKDLIRDLHDRIETCSNCRGSGFDDWKKGENACPYCGGQGRVLDATALITEIEELFESIHENR